MNSRDQVDVSRDETSNPLSSRRPAPLLRPGETCWRIEHARRFRVLVDGAAYFAVLRRAIAQARHSVYIVGWDIDSRMELMPGAPDDGLPAPLGDFLCAVAQANPQLHVHILAWDFAMLYAMEREWLPQYKLGWKTPSRVHFRLDGRHPPGASRHQKIVVIDDALAFVGGIDLTRSRWDTPAHAPAEPRRRNGPKLFYQPFHDIHTMFDGDAAHAVGALVRRRWEHGANPQAHRGADATLAHEASPASQHSPSPSPPSTTPSARDIWPDDVEADIEDVELGISITEPPFEGRPAVAQIQQLYLDALATARQNVYIENQYFTASAVGDAIARRLEEADGPSFAIVVPQEQTGWLQAATMGTLRARLYRKLAAADRHGRLRMYAPWIAGLNDAFINVHSKLMTVDDDVLIIGSANLNNRSMVLDSECNVVLDARGQQRVRDAIARVRNQLIAEHVDVPPHHVSDAFARGLDINSVIAELTHDDRKLAPLEPYVSPEMDRLVPEAALIDPELPSAPDEVVRQFAPGGGGGRSLVARISLLATLALGAVGMTLAWKHTGLGQWLNLDTIGHTAHSLAAMRFGPVLIVGIYALAAVASVPVTLLIALSGLLFGAIDGSLYALSGTLLASVITYLIGASLGRELVRRHAGARLNRLSERLGRQGIVAVVFLRVVPLAPFMLINLAAGASHIGLRDFLIGTAIGMGPGIVLATTFAHQLVTALHHPGPGPLLLLAGIGLALVGLSVTLQRLFSKR